MKLNTIMNFPRRRRRSQELRVPSRQRQSYFEKDKPVRGKKIKSIIFFISVVFFFFFCFENEKKGNEKKAEIGFSTLRRCLLL